MKGGGFLRIGKVLDDYTTLWLLLLSSPPCSISVIGPAALPLQLLNCPELHLVASARVMVMRLCVHSAHVLL